MKLTDKIELNKIYCENCLDTMARMPDGFVDLTVTSPPYDNLRDYNGYEFEFEKIANELFRVTKDGGVVVWVVGDSYENGGRRLTPFFQGIDFKQVGFSIYDTMIYRKTGVPIPQRPEIRYYNCYEFMFILAKGSRPSSINLITQKNISKVGRFKKAKRQRNGELLVGYFNQRDHRPKDNIWKYASSSCNIEGSKIHPATFPEQLAADHIYSWSNKGDLVYDPFMGSGTTAKEAHLQDRNWIGSEISQEYVDLANKRLKPYLTQIRMEL